MPPDLLSRIDAPADLRKLALPDLETLAGEIRQYIIEVLSERGGHLASSLGSVELTLALHYVFDSPRDRIVWDVGHQSYTHKIVTGRRELFKDLRTRGGISGFPRIAESEHDIFGAGHACTAISAALGLAAARDIRGGDHFVIGVVGDGSISGGMALEGINHAGHLKKNRFIVVLNDNEMSISRNVGALAKYLTRITTRKPYLQLEADVWELLGKIPTLGGKAQTLAGRIKESIKNLVVPTLLFEELGFRYFGPLDGHDIGQLIETFAQLHQVPGPVLVHVVTKKGKGYPFAERDAERYHGVGSFYKTTGGSRRKAGAASHSSVFGTALVELARRDPRIVAITAAMTEGTGLAPFAAEFPDRFFDVGISEQHAVTFAAGLAREGMRPFVAIYSTFLQRGFDQVIHDVALQGLPVRFIIDRAGIVGEDGPTHHGTFDLSYLGMIPGMVVMAPADECELRRMVLACASYDAGPVSMRFPRGAVTGIDTGACEDPIPLGKGRMLRSGEDTAIIAIGTMVLPSLEAANILACAGIDTAVFDARFLKPLDEETVVSLAKKTGSVFTVEENSTIGGLGDAVSLSLSRERAALPVHRIGIPDLFVSHGERGSLLDEIGLTASRIAATIRGRMDARLNGSCGGDR
ncbi:MAG: 1-deoxy-D-xylulose-5-phosphate synthase [Candidatus Krumholzibacteria bacterium]|nr:1-deoxy-D-xylulose-5-phosphate synthase [Candidatus Krumholzibacteria bacterium]